MYRPSTGTAIPRAMVTTLPTSRPVPCGGFCFEKRFHSPLFSGIFTHFGIGISDGVSESGRTDSGDYSILKFGGG
jgi:hypothetical protein